MTDITDKLKAALLSTSAVPIYQILELAEEHSIEIDLDEEEAWIRGISSQGDFILSHRKFPIIILKYKMPCNQLEIHNIITVKDYESKELSLNPSEFDINELGWHTSLYPEDENGIDLRSFSASDLFYATV